MFNYKHKHTYKQINIYVKGQTVKRLNILLSFYILVHKYFYIQV